MYQPTPAATGLTWCVVPSRYGTLYRNTGIAHGSLVFFLPRPSAAGSTSKNRELGRQIAVNQMLLPGALCMLKLLDRAAPNWISPAS